MQLQGGLSVGRLDVLGCRLLRHAKHIVEAPYEHAPRGLAELLCALFAMHVHVCMTPLFMRPNMHAARQ